MVSEGIIIESHGTESQRDRMKMPPFAVIQVITDKRRSLKRISAVQHQSIAVLLYLV